MYNRIMNSLKKLLISNYNLGRASQPVPLPEKEVRLDYVVNVIHSTPENKPISRDTLRRAFLDNKNNESSHSPEPSQQRG